MKNEGLQKAKGATTTGSATTAGLAMAFTFAPTTADAQTAGRAETTDLSAGLTLPVVSVMGEVSGNTNAEALSISRLPGGTIQETPKTVNVVPQEIIQQQHATSLQQILRNVPGITMSTGEGNGGQTGDQFRIRGLSSRGDIYVDGLRDFGSYSRDAFNTESVQVIKGPSGEAFGVGNLGGVINQTTKKAHLGTTTDIDQNFASASTYRTMVDSNVQINETTALRINGMFQRGNVADRDYVKDNRGGVAIDFGTGIGTDTVWHLNYSYLNRDGIADLGIPMATGRDGIVRPLTEYNVPGYRSSTSYTRNLDHDRTNTHMVTSLFSTKLANGFIVSNGTRISIFDRDFMATNPAALSFAGLQTLLAGGNTAVSYGAGGGMTYLQRGWGVQDVLSAKGEFNLGGFRNRLLVGVDGSHQDDHRDQATWTGRVNNQNILYPNYYYPGAPTVTYGATMRTANASNIGVFGTDRLWLTDTFSLQGSLRWDYFRSEYQTNAAGVGGGIAESKKLSPSVAAILEPSHSYSFYAAFGRTYRPVGTDIAVAVGGVGTEVPQAGVSNQPERADIYELGTKLNFLDDQLGLTGAVFQINKSNSFTVDPATGDVTPGFSENGESRMVRGVEFGTTGKVTKNWSTYFGYSYLDGDVTYSGTATSIGNLVPGVSHHNFVLWTSYDIPWNLMNKPGMLSIGGGAQYASAYWADSANTARIPETFSLDAMIGYKIDKFRLSLNLYNLTDHLNYASSFNAVRTTPTSRRTFLVNLGMTF